MPGRVYTRPESKHLWIEFKRADGSKIRKSAGTADPEEARGVLAREYARSRSLTFQDAVVNFFEIKERTLRPGSLDNYRLALRTMHPYFGHLTMDEITLDGLKDFVRARRKQVSDTTVKRDLSFLSSVFSCSIETLPGGPKVNMVTMLPKRSLKDVTRDRWLKPAEYEALLAACTENMHRMIIKTAVHTGMRHGELAGLRKSNINFERKEVVLDAVDVKNNRERVVPLCAWLAEELRELCANTPGDLVFCHQDSVTKEWAPYQEFKNFWTAARRRSKVKDVRFHDLRHTFASWWVQSGGSLMVLRDILGHSTLQMVERYAHLNTDAKHVEVQRVFAHTMDTLKNTGTSK